jgi:hypothetical protein
MHASHGRTNFNNGFPSSKYHYLFGIKIYNAILYSNHKKLMIKLKRMSSSCLEYVKPS